MTSRQRLSFRVLLVAIVCLQAVCLVSNVTAFSMVRRYDNLNGYPSEQLRDLIDFEYAEEPSVPIPVKRQKNQGGTCTCTCETRPVNDEPKTRPAGSQYSEMGSLLRTGGTGVVPQSAARVLEKPYQSKSDVKDAKPETKVNRPSTDINSQIIKLEPWDYSDMVNMEPSKQEEEEEEEDQVEQTKEEERPQPKQEIETKTTPASAIKTEQSSEQDAWGHGRRFPWKHLRNEMCFRESCKTDTDCCMRYNLCDKSAKVCVDCWYGSTCTSEQDCCQRFPYCQRVWKKHQVTGSDYVSNGKCVNKLP